MPFVVKITEADGHVCWLGKTTPYGWRDFESLPDAAVFADYSEVRLAIADIMPTLFRMRARYEVERAPCDVVQE